MIKTWLGLHDVHPTDWGGMVSVKEWWRSNTYGRSQSRRPLVSLIPISWEIWNERNARVFRNNATPVVVLVTHQSGGIIGVPCRTKYLCNIMPRE
ncbi:hypothetical protein CFC21_061162 [Triticum aestivum]|uniref:Uncharacterized protein n=2 Tax=Triticum aestivum TaxID=4565 RepID=A0A9R1KGG0_WHEAT|nr:hypothetical protein CFC21_061162 [Triticum aestivum]